MTALNRALMPLALAAALACPLAAHAAGKTLDFEGLTDSTGAALAAGSAASGITGYSAIGITFGGGSQLLDVSSLSVLDPDSNTSQFGLIGGQLTAGSTATIEVNIDSTVSKFNILNFLFLGAMQLTVYAHDASGNLFERSPDIAGTNVFDQWNQSRTYTFDSTWLIDRLVFQLPTVVSGLPYFAVDNLSFDVQATGGGGGTGGGSVPEPGSLALAGLAVAAAAGSALRRRRAG